MKSCCSGVLAVMAAALLAAGPAQAASVLFSGSSGSLAASVSFESSGGNLIVTLTNTSLADVLVPESILTAVFFDLAGSPTLATVSAVLATGSGVLFPPATFPLGYNPVDGVGVVGGEWAYKAGLVGAPDGATQGISSAGFGLVGPSDRFPGTNLQGPDSPNGTQYGITSAGDNPVTGNAAVTGSNALIKNSVVFTLSGLPDGFVASSSSITNVSFQYGTGLDEPNIPGTPETPVGNIPEPSGLVGLAGMGLVVALAWRRRRRTISAG